MKRRTPQPGKHLISASPWLLAAACALLTFIIVVFAVNNYRREKRLAEASLAQEGRTILELVDSNSRATLRRALVSGEESADPLIGSVQQVIDNTSDHERISALYFVDEHGMILAHDNRERLGERVDEATLARIAMLTAEQRLATGRIEGANGSETSVFQVLMPFHPLPADRRMGPLFREGGRGRFGRFPGAGAPALMRERLEQLLDSHTYVFVVELSTEAADQGVRKQFTQLVVLSLTLFLVGVGGLLSLLMLQGLKGSQARLQRISAFTDILVSSLPIGIIATGNNGVVRTCNQSACAMLGLDPDTVVGKKPGEALPPSLSRAISAPRHGFGEPTWEFDVDGEKGASRSLHCTRVEIEDDVRTISGVMILMQDLSQLRHLEHELQRAERDAVVGRMAAGVAHELRNPLSSIKGLALLLKKRMEEADLRPETADLLVEEVERLNRSIGELLDYAKPGRLTREKTDIDDLVTRALVLIRSDIEAAGIIVEKDLRCGDRAAAVDRDKLTQVVLNLSLNAMQAMQRGGILRVTTDCSADSVSIAIRDNGTGIAADLLEKVFEPYVTTKRNGTGLGLSLSAKIVADHGGEIFMESEVGAGTTVSVKLPR